MQVLKQTIFVQDIDENTPTLLTNWGFHQNTIDNIMRSMMTQNAVTISMNDITNAVDYEYGE